MANLKLAQVIKRNINDIIDSTEELLSINGTSFLEVRAFLRTCDLDIESLLAFARGVSTDFDDKSFMATTTSAQAIPISKKPLLNGTEISKLLNVKGADIKKAQDLLFKIEDQFVLENAKALPSETAQALLVEKWK